MSTIPAGLFVSVNPSVLAAGGSALDLNGLILTTSTRVPIGTVMSFPDGETVAEFFGTTSKEAQIASGGPGLGSGYFGGFDTATVTPAAILFAQYPIAAVAAYLRGGNVSGLSLTQLQGFNGQLSATIDGNAHTASINLSGVTSFTNAAQLIETDLAISGVQQGTVTATIAANVMTVSAVLTGGAPLAVGDKVTGTGVTAASFISSFGTGTGGAGTYNLTQSSTVGSPTTVTSFAPAVSYDSVSGGFVIASGTTGNASTMAFASGALAVDLMLTQATGAVLSQGADAATPGAFMDGMKQVTQNWASFMTGFDPDQGSGITQKLAFASWANAQKNRFVYIAWDTAAAAATQVPATATLGYAISQANYSATCLVWEVGNTNLAAMVCGFIASVNFSQAGGRVSFAFKKQSGMTASVTTEAAAVNLGGNPQVPGDRGNGYNYYGAVATANQAFIDFQRGMVSGPFQWLDTLIDQIWLTNALQLALMNLLEQTNAIPFNAAGDALIEAALADPIQAALSFGAIATGITLSSAQIAAVNAAAGGKNIADIISTQGWYLLLPAVSPSIRQARGPRSITFFYVDGESVQSISLSSTTIL
jgi:hypothetical protein